MRFILYKKGLPKLKNRARIVKNDFDNPKGGALKMAKCEICGKEKVFEMQVSHSHRRSSKAWHPNIRTVKAVVDGTPKKLKVCSRCLRSGLVERA